MNEGIAKKSGRMLEFIATKRAAALLVIVVSFCLIFAVIYPKTFGTFENVSTILLNMSAEAFIVIALVPLLVSGEIDLSLGSLMAFGSILCGRLMKLGDMDMGLAILISTVVAVGCGFINGFIVAKLNVVSFIATLATGMIYLGLAVMLAGTGWTDFDSPIFTAMGQEKLLGLQLPIYYMVAGFVIFSVLIARTRYFRQLYYIGGNTKAAELSGINVPRVKITTYMLAAMLACFAGIISAMRFNSSITNVGTGVEMRAVTAAVIGGVSFTGGSGSMIGAAMGALFVACLNNALTIANISPNMQYIVTGIVLVLAIVVDIVLSNRKSERC